MSALAFLSGMASGAGDELSKQGEQKRQFEQQNKMLLADTINKRLATENLDWPTYQSLRMQEYQARGVKPADAQQLLTHEKPIYDAHQAEFQKQQGLGQATPNTNSGTAPNTSTPPTAGLGPIPQPGGAPQASAAPSAVPSTLAPTGPGFETGEVTPPQQGGNSVYSTSSAPAGPAPQQSSQLSPMPQAPGGFFGTGTGRAMDAAQAQGVMTDVQIDKQRRLLALMNATDLAQSAQHPGNGTVDSGVEQHIRSERSLGPQGISERIIPDAGVRSPRPVYGEDILREYPQSDVTPHGWYSSVNYAQDGVRFRPTTPNTTKFAEYDPNSSTKVSLVQRDPKGNEVNREESADKRFLPVATSGGSTVYKIDPDTNKLIPVKQTQQRTTTPVLPGQEAPGPLGSIPTAKNDTTPAGQSTAPIPGSAAAVNSTKPITIPQGSGGKVVVPKSGSPFDPTNPIDRAIYFSGIDTKMGDDIKKDLPKGNYIKEALSNRAAELGVIPNEVDAAERSRSLMAQSLIPHMEAVYNLIHQAEAEGELGVVKTRWNQLLTGKVGDDPTPDHIYSKLATNLSFLGSATAMVHGGLRGGSSPGMIQHWDEAIRAADPETMLAELGQVYEWMKGYQNIARPEQASTISGGKLGTTHTPQTLTGGPLSPVPVNQGTTPVPQVGGQFGGGKVLKVERVQ